MNTDTQKLTDAFDVAAHRIAELRYRVDGLTESYERKCRELQEVQADRYARVIAMDREEKTAVQRHALGALDEVKTIILWLEKRPNMPMSELIQSLQRRIEVLQGLADHVRGAR